MTHAQISYPEYFDPIMKYGPDECITALQSAVKAIDTVLDLPEPLPTALKTLFGLGQLKDKADFAEVLRDPLGASTDEARLKADPCFRIMASQELGSERWAIDWMYCKTFLMALQSVLTDSWTSAMP